MPVTSLENSKSEIKVAKKMRDYDKEPVFKKQADNAVSFLKEHGLPKELHGKKKP